MRILFLCCLTKKSYLKGRDHTQEKTKMCFTRRLLALLLRDTRKEKGYTSSGSLLLIRLLKNSSPLFIITFLSAGSESVGILSHDGGRITQIPI